MELLYKPDWEETKQRYLAWWAHDNTDRCLLQVVSPKESAPREDPPTPPEDVERRWLDHDYLCALNDWQMRRIFFGAEAVPIWHPGYPGWAWIPCYLGAPVTLAADTGWVDPIISDGALTDHDYSQMQMDRECRWWKLAVEMLHLGVRQARGRCLTTIGAIGGCGDTLATIRGTNELLHDLIDCPDHVREFDQHLMKLWIELYEHNYRIITDVCEGSTCWFPLWSPGKFYAAQNDFAYMISPRMYEEIFLPTVEMQTNYLDHCVYHVDGIGNFAHVDALCTLPRLQALQILPGAGKPSPLYYMDVLKKVQKAGKNLHIGLPANEVETALSELSARGLCMSVWCDTEADAKALIENCRKWSRDRIA